MRLGLETDSDMFDWARDDGVGNARKRAREVVLSIGKRRWRGGVGGGVRFFELTARPVEGTKLDGDLDTNWWCS
jgi:hypothetical protein